MEHLCIPFTVYIMHVEVSIEIKAAIFSNMIFRPIIMHVVRMTTKLDCHHCLSLIAAAVSWATLASNNSGAFIHAGAITVIVGGGGGR